METNGNNDYSLINEELDAAENEGKKYMILKLLKLRYINKQYILLYNIPK